MSDTYPHWFEISDDTNTVSVTKYEALRYSQTYESSGGSTLGRMMNGRAFKQTHWNKLATTISGDGILPAGLGIIDYSQELLLKCGTPRSLVSPSTTIAMPPYRTGDDGLSTTTVEYRLDGVYAPSAMAWVDNYWVPTPVSVASNVATVTSVLNATRYKVIYYPQILVYCEQDPSETFQHGSDLSTGWSISAVQK